MKQNYKKLNNKQMKNLLTVLIMIIGLVFTTNVQASTVSTDNVQTIALSTDGGGGGLFKRKLTGMGVALRNQKDSVKSGNKTLKLIRKNNKKRNKVAKRANAGK